jgi:hypothetical protein
MDDGFAVNQTITGTVVESVEVFRTDFSFYVAAAAVELCSVLVILTTFWGWWRLGRSASLSPLEIAKVLAWERHIWPFDVRPCVR